VSDARKIQWKEGKVCVTELLYVLVCIREQVSRRKRQRQRQEERETERRERERYRQRQRQRETQTVSQTQTCQSFCMNSMCVHTQND